uniref:MICOS complex subunit n=1 Tax=Amphilophus citrinellus TaxID=61819 RepID=A0A3Q0S7D3_AMPCI
MAAKVVMVAVPTVLGIASIRVYTVKEAPTDGLVTRERLNVYTPLPQSNQATFVPESPGVFESGVTTARESVLPFVKAVKGACISVKRGSVDLYHAGEDVFYYLKDPPPGFLPRFGTITMAGLLGMFLARKGSRFKRLAIPLGLMSAGASVCYPAQAVAVLKVTGKKVYAAGQWSRAAASSLLASKEPVAKETAGSQPQVNGLLSKHYLFSDTEVKSADPISDEPIVAVITEEESSVTTREISPNQAPTETSTGIISIDPLSAPPSMELPAPVEGEEASDRKQASGDVSSDTSPSKPASSEPETAEAVPVESASYSEVTSAPKASDEPAGTKDFSRQRAEDFSKVSLVELADSDSQLQVPAVDETPGSSFKPDPSLMDFGQSSPEDEDLYSTRS